MGFNNIKTEEQARKFFEHHFPDALNITPDAPAQFIRNPASIKHFRETGLIMFLLQAPLCLCGSHPTIMRAKFCALATPRMLFPHSLGRA
jgi:hypothetical protein